MTEIICKRCNHQFKGILHHWIKYNCNVLMFWKWNKTSLNKLNQEK